MHKFSALFQLWFLSKVLVDAMSLRLNTLWHGGGCDNIPPLWDTGGTLTDKKWQQSAILGN